MGGRGMGSKNENFCSILTNIVVLKSSEYEYSNGDVDENIWHSITQLNSYNVL